MRARQAASACAAPSGSSSPKARRQWWSCVAGFEWTCARRVTSVARPPSRSTSRLAIKIASEPVSVMSAAIANGRLSGNVSSSPTAATRPKSGKRTRKVRSASVVTSSWHPDVTVESMVKALAVPGENSARPASGHESRRGRAAGRRAARITVPHGDTRRAAPPCGIFPRQFAEMPFCHASNQRPRVGIAPWGRQHRGSVFPIFLAPGLPVT